MIELNLSQQSQIEVQINDIKINQQNILSIEEIQHISYTFNVISINLIGIFEEILYLEKMIYSNPTIKLKFYRGDKLIQEQDYAILETKSQIQPQIEQQESLISSSSPQVINIKLVDKRYFDMLNNYSCKSFKNWKISEIAQYFQDKYGFVDQIIEDTNKTIRITKQFVNDLEFLQYLQVLQESQVGKNYVFSVRYNTFHFHSIEYLEKFGAVVLDYRSSSKDKIFESYFDGTVNQGYALNLFNKYKQHYYNWDSGEFEDEKFELKINKYNPLLKQKGFQQNDITQIIQTSKQNNGLNFYFPKQFVRYKMFQNSQTYNNLLLSFPRTIVPFVLFAQVELKDTVENSLDGKYFVQGVLRQYSQQMYSIVELQRITPQE